ncbi:Protein of uncharacterised function (DUF1602) [Flavonifractor plautii]|uniref:Protein of uncharacterized function (DUF1602) n=1 Tax=Flavonifractor plautii TaxID=292800 RepID=A0A174JFQ8_FLAPL|nr:Protein of uncharacterised function (DUF1602) [Flavonifractor plautii]
MSRWLVGSSSTSTAVCWARARAISTRCFSPPDRVENPCSRREASPVRARISPTSARSSRLSLSSSRLRACRPIMTTSSTVKSKAASCSCTMTASRWAISRLLMASRSSPMRVSSPAWGRSTL